MIGRELDGESENGEESNGNGLVNKGERSGVEDLGNVEKNHNPLAVEH